MIARIQSLITSWFSSLDNLGTGFVFLAIAFAGLGGFVEFEPLNFLGLACFGAAIVTWGANAIVSRELAIFQRGIPVSERVQEFLARAWGIVFACGGLFLLGYAILNLINPRSPTPAILREFFATTPGTGVLLLGGSIVGMLFALTSVFVSDTQGRNALVRFLLSLPGRLFGLVLLLVCVAVAGVALILILAPDAWQTLLQEFLNRLGL